MKIIGTSHMQLNSMDVERSRAFYENGFGGHVVARIPQKDSNELKGYLLEIAEGFVLELQPPRLGPSEKTSAWNTIAIETDDIEAACAQIVKAGGTLEVPPNKGAMGTIPIMSCVLIGTEDEHIELIQLL